MVTITKSGYTRTRKVFTRERSRYVKHSRYVVVHIACKNHPTITQPSPTLSNPIQPSSTPPHPTITHRHTLTCHTLPSPTVTHPVVLYRYQALWATRSAISRSIFLGRIVSLRNQGKLSRSLLFLFLFEFLDRLGQLWEFNGVEAIGSNCEIFTGILTRNLW